MKYFAKIPGEKVYLSPRTPEDAATYARWMNDLTITERLGNPDGMSTAAIEREGLANNNGRYNFSIIEAGTDRLVGNCEFMEVSFLHGTAMVGMWIGEADCRGKGYGAEALDLLLGYGFNYLNLHSVALHVYGFNTPAIRCYRKLGFKETGRRRECYRIKGCWYDEIHMDILAEEWFARHAEK